MTRGTDAGPTGDEPRRGVEGRRKAFGTALAKRRRELSLSQTALGKALGGVGQSAVSQWECGDTEPRPDHVYLSEKALGLTPGTLSRLLGYLPPSGAPRGAPGGVREAIRRDPLLTGKEKRTLLALYDSLTAGRSAEADPTPRTASSVRRS